MRYTATPSGRSAGVGSAAGPAAHATHTAHMAWGARGVGLGLRRHPSLCGSGALALVVGIGAGLRALALYDVPQPSAGEATLVTGVVELTRSGTGTAGGVADLGLRTATLAVPQFASACRLAGCWDRAPSALGAVREVSLLAWVLVAPLCWLLARRLGMSRPWALASVGLLALCPTAIGVSRLAVPENLAACWGLAALVLAAGRHRVGWAQFRLDLVIAGCLTVAVLTAPAGLALAPAVLLVAARHGDARRTALLGVLILVTVGPGVAVSVVTAPAGLLPVAPEGPAIRWRPGWLGLDVVTGVLAALLALRSPGHRPLAVGVLAVPVVGLPLGVPASELYPLAVPLAAILVASVAREWGGTARPGLLRSASAVLLVGPLAVTSAVNLVRLPGATAPPPATWARDWLRTNTAGSDRVLTDERLRVALAKGTDEWDRVSTPAACARLVRLSPAPSQPTGCTDPNWWVLAAGPAEPAPPPGATLIAEFGAEGDPGRIAVRGTRWPVADPERELRARRAAGALLAASSRLRVDPGLADTLRAGRLDSRAATALGGLLTEQPLHLVDLPPIPGEQPADRPLRQLLITADGPRPGAATPSPEQAVADFFAAQLAPYRPYAIAITPAGVQVRYSPQGPPGLLDTFLTR